MKMPNNVLNMSLSINIIRNLELMKFKTFKYLFILYTLYSGFGGLGIACWTLVPKFVGSNPAEAVGFLRAKKSSARLPSEGK